MNNWLASLHGAERVWRRCVISLLLTLVGSHTAALATETAAHENYRVLAWEDLVPAGWEPPMVATAFDEVSDNLRS